MDRDHYAEKPNDFKAFELYDAVTAKCDAIAKVKASKEDFDIYQNITL